MIEPIPSDVIMACPHCKAPLPNDVITATGHLPCTHCRAEVQVEAFPSLIRRWEESGVHGQLLQDDHETGDLSQSQSGAEPSCEACPACVEETWQNGQPGQLVTQRTLHDMVALSLAVIPLLFFWITIITAPLAIYMAIRNWHTPSGPLPRSKCRYVIAIAIGAVQVLAWTAFLVHSAI